jgi:predicted GIY-YIG superfamily endonuclease
MNLNEVNVIVNKHTKSLISDSRKEKIITRLKNKQVEILWDLAFKSNSDSKIPVKCLIDGEYSIYYTNHLVRGVISCDYCLIAKYKDLFLNKGFKYTDKFAIKGVTHVRGNCLKCNNSVTAKTLNLFGKYAIICQNCEHKKITDSLETKNCEYISEKLVNYIRRITYKNVSGELFENSQTTILRGNFTSGGSHWKQQHSLYLITCKFNDVFYFKIGTANNPNQRLSILKLLGETSVITLEKFDTRYAASKQEKHLHKLFKCSNLDKEVAKLFTTGYSKLGKKAGITEWFTEDILPELKQIYKLKDN